MSSSFERRIRDCRHALTLELALQNGPFWTEVEALRRRFGITPISSVPSILLFPFPPNSSEASFGPWQWHLKFFTDADYSPIATEWISQIFALHERVITEPCRPAGATTMSVDLWGAFLAACVLYDPPRDAVIEFADAFALTPERFSDFPTFDALGIVIGHPRAQVAYLEFIGGLIEEVSKRIPPSSGVDVRSIVRQVLEETKLAAELQERTRPDRQRFAIAVDSETTEDDVRKAFRMIRNELAPDRKGGRPKPSDLVYVQAALWDEQGWTIRSIAERLDLTLEKDEYGTRRRSDTAKAYIQRGQDILAKRRKTPRN